MRGATQGIIALARKASPRSWIGSGLLALSLGCGAIAPPGPPELRSGFDECAHCRMIVSEPRFGAVARSASGREARFDDVGCAERFLADPANTVEPWEVWLHAFEGEGWIPSMEVWLVHDPSLTTPMGHGLVAYDDETGARQRASRSPGATVRRWAP